MVFGRLICVVRARRKSRSRELDELFPTAFFAGLWRYILISQKAILLWSDYCNLLGEKQYINTQKIKNNIWEKINKSRNVFGSRNDSLIDSVFCFWLRLEGNLMWGSLLSDRLQRFSFAENNMWLWKANMHRQSLTKKPIERARRDLSNGFLVGRW